MSYVDMRGMPSRDEVVDHYAEVSGRQVDDLDYYLVLAKWKLAIVLEQGFQRAGDDEKLLAYGPVITSTDAVGGRSRRDQRLPVRAAVCPAYGPPDVVRIEEQPSPAVAAGQVRVRVAAAAVNFPDVLLIANQYQISVPAPFVPGSEFAGVIVETGDGCRRVSRSATGSPARACTARSPKRSPSPPPGWPASPTASTTAPPPHSASRTARRITRCVRWRACSRATS